MCRVLFFVVLSMFWIATYCYASNGVMVWRLEAGSGVDLKTVKTVSGFLTSQIEQNTNQKIISEAEIQTILKGEETRQKCGMEETSCISEVGNALGVLEAISGDLGRMGDYWILNLRRIDVQSAEVIRRVSRDIKGDTNSLIETIPQAVKELLKSDAGKPISEADPDTSTSHFIGTQTDTEWVTLRLGYGYYGYSGTVGLFTLRYENIYWQILRGSGGGGADEMGECQDGDSAFYGLGGTLVGYPIYLTDKKNHEIRIGAGIMFGRIWAGSDNSRNMSAVFPIFPIEILYSWCSSVGLVLQLGFEAYIPAFAWDAFDTGNSNGAIYPPPPFSGHIGFSWR